MYRINRFDLLAGQRQASFVVILTLIFASAKGRDEQMVTKLGQYAQRGGLKGGMRRIAVPVVGVAVSVDDASVTELQFQKRSSFLRLLWIPGVTILEIDVIVNSFFHSVGRSGFEIKLWISSVQYLPI